MGDEVQIDPRVGPELQPREVGDRRVAGDVQPALAPHLAEHGGHARVGGDDQVGVVGTDQPHQAALAERRQQLARQPPGRREVHEQHVLEVEQPRQPLEHEGRVLAQHLGQDRAHRRQPVDDRDLGVGILVPELARDRAGGEIVALADVGGDDQHLAGLGLGVGLAGRDDRRLLLLGLGLGLLVAPVDVAPHALGERRRGGPAQLSLGALAGDDLAAEVAGAGRGVDDLDVAHQLLDRLGDLLDRDGLVAGQVVDAVDGHVARARARRRRRDPRRRRTCATGCRRRPGSAGRRPAPC